MTHNIYFNAKNYLEFERVSRTTQPDSDTFWFWRLPRIAPASALRRPCPFCAEPIRVGAKLCPHCRSELPAPDAAQLAAIEQAANPPMGTDAKIVIGVVSVVALLVLLGMLAH